MLTPERTKQIAFQAIQLLRTVVTNEYFTDEKKADDWIFKQMDLESCEVNEIFANYPKTTVHTENCFADGTSPKNFDQIEFA